MCIDVHMNGDMEWSLIWYDITYVCFGHTRIASHVLRKPAQPTQLPHLYLPPQFNIPLPNFKSNLPLRSFLGISPSLMKRESTSLHKSEKDNFDHFSNVSWN